MQQIKLFKQGSQEYNQALDLRYVILRLPLGLQFTEAELEKDKHDLHFGLWQGSQLAACLTLTAFENGRMKMRQVAVDRGMQQQGYGKTLCLAAEVYARQNGYHTMFCNARKTAVPFYQKLGYQIVSDEFTEVGIPHYTMEKQL